MFWNKGEYIILIKKIFKQKFDKMLLYSNGVQVFFRLFVVKRTNFALVKFYVSNS